MENGKPMMPMAKVVVVLIVLVVLGAAGMYWKESVMLPKELRGDKMKAVFLDNGQVYFGETSTANKDFLLVKNPYYLQSKTVLQEPVEEGKEPQKRQQLSLSGLGKPGLQIHGPEKEIYIPWDSILFIENLRTDSEVVKLMEADKNGTATAPVNTNAATTNTNAAAEVKQ